MNFYHFIPVLKIFLFQFPFLVKSVPGRHRGLAALLSSLVLQVAESPLASLTLAVQRWAGWVGIMVLFQTGSSSICIGLFI